MSLSTSKHAHNRSKQKIPIEKNLLRSTSERPLRFALLGPPKSSKSSIVSIISSGKSIGNYYPTVQNSPTLIQFQPKSVKARALLDVNATLDELEDVNVIGNKEFKITQRVLDAVAEATTVIPSESTIPLLSSASILGRTLNYYDLDYTRPDYFETDLMTSLSPISSPIASYSIGSHSDPFIKGVMSDRLSDEDSNSSQYRPPVTTPILVELIDTPGVQRNDLIPFLEKGLDSKLAKDVLRNLINEADASSRSRVKPLLTGSGMSELNAAMDGYLLCYSCIPETANEAAPPSYDDAIASSSDKSSDSKYHSETQDGYEPIEIVKALYTAIMEAWKQYTNYQIGWEEGKEFDVYSLNYSFKHLWKKRNLPKNISGQMITNKAREMMPPVLIAVTHVDHELASPILIEKGRQLAKEWNCGFIEVSCEFENWRNVEETVAFLIRDRIEDIKRKKKNKVNGFGI